MRRPLPPALVLPQPTLHGRRVLLRPFRVSDAPVVTRLAGDAAIADTTLTVPHPYGPGVAEAWIARHQPGWERGTDASFAIATPAEGVVGAIGLALQREHWRAELGYWVGVPYWGRGYCTEAVRLLLAFAFGELGLHRVYAQHFVRNPASGRVMQKVGMRHEGRLRGHLVKGGQPEDSEMYGILAHEFPG